MSSPHSSPDGRPDVRSDVRPDGLHGSPDAGRGAARRGGGPGPAADDSPAPSGTDAVGHAEAAGDLLGRRLVGQGRLGERELARALRVQEENGGRLGELLVQLGFVAERDVARVLASQLGLALAGADDYGEVAVLPNQVTPEFLRHAGALPIDESDQHVVVAMADPTDRYTLDALALALGKRVEPRVGVRSEIEAAFQRQYGEAESSMAQIVADLDGPEESEVDDIQRLRDQASEAPIIRVVNLLVTRALRTRASDIHVEPFESALKVRYRIDGVLRDVEAPPVRSTAAVISRVKVMAGLNIAERRRPQDGRIKLRIEGREVDMRISTVPTMHGESVVMRILDKSSVPLDFPSLGFTPDLLPTFEEVLGRPHGIVLVTGPTGSGKTTTLYAALQRLNTPDKKLLTVEDPVEYQLEGINQIQVKPQIGLDFASALRSILRQDPDVIMVGEMRDLETAKIAVQSALTGHKVFSTLHTNDAASSVTRMLDMGIEDFLLTSTLNGILAQRLVRTLCTACRETYRAPRDRIEALGITPPQPGREVTLYRAPGCDECEGTGYRGRTGILELLVVSDAVGRAILEHGDAKAIQRVALDEGMRSMYEDGLRKALAGLTTVEEVVRVTQEG